MLDRAWKLKETVALRAEPFGALAYDFDTRRLSFLKHPRLVAAVRALDDQATANAALDAAGVAAEERPAFARALAQLDERGMLVERAA